MVELVKKEILRVFGGTNGCRCKSNLSFESDKKSFRDLFNQIEYFSANSKLECRTICCVTYHFDEFQFTEVMDEFEHCPPQAFIKSGSKHFSSSHPSDNGCCIVL